MERGLGKTHLTQLVPSCSPRRARAPGSGLGQSPACAGGLLSPVRGGSGFWGEAALSLPLPPNAEQLVSRSCARGAWGRSRALGEMLSSVPGRRESVSCWEHGARRGGARFPPPPQGSPAHPSQKVKVKRRLEQQRSGLFDTKC